MLGVGNTNGTG